MEIKNCPACGGKKTLPTLSSYFDKEKNVNFSYWFDAPCSLCRGTGIVGTVADKDNTLYNGRPFPIIQMA